MLLPTAISLIDEELASLRVNVHFPYPLGESKVDVI